MERNSGPEQVAQSRVQVIVGISELAVVGSRTNRLITHALGSCIAVTVFDPVASVGGMLHFMLPMPAGDSTQIGRPWSFASLGLPALFKTAYALGADKRRLVVCAAGGAELSGNTDGTSVGLRNRTALRKLLWKNDVSLAAEDTGGQTARTMELDLATGAVSVRAGGSLRTIWPDGSSGRVSA